MLSEIYIRNYLFVPEQRLSFDKGMTVLSGETGAGKSILVGSISLIFGDSSPALEAFDPKQGIYLEASFDISGNAEVQAYLQEQGYELESELCLAREISVAGKSVYFINGRKASLALLKELKPLMIDFHHQRDQQRLLASSYQLQLLDLYAQNSALGDKFTLLFRALKQNLKLLSALRTEEENNRQFSELYQYQYDELEKANLHPGEDSELQQEFELLSHAKEISETAESVSFDLYERENSVYAEINQAVNSLGHFSGINQRFAGVEQSLRDCLEIISDSATALNDINDHVNSDPGRLESIQERLDEINNLLYKHKAQDIAALLELFARREAEINAFTDLSDRIKKLDAKVAADFRLLQKAADELSKSRQKAAKKLCSELLESISALSIPDARFEILIDKKAHSGNEIQEYLDSCTEHGQDDCQFFFSANRGSDLKPLSAVASGGELSRILLAIKKVLSDRIEEKLIILDEIDAGIGGKTAERVAGFIFRLSQRHRILCITHLAQIAAIAHQHIALEKVAGKQKNIIRMTSLQKSERLEELARMLAGDVSRISLKHAEELINKYNIRG